MLERLRKLLKDSESPFTVHLTRFERTFPVSQQGQIPAVPSPKKGDIELAIHSVDEIGIAGVIMGGNRHGHPIEEIHVTWRNIAQLEVDFG